MTQAAFDTQAASDVLMAVGQLIVSDKAYQSRPWDSLTVVAKLDGGKSMFGYVYTADGDWAAQAPDSFDVLRRLADLKKAMAKPGEPDWKTCRIQIKRPDLKMHADFDYDDADRWSVTPANLEQRVEELRPR